jgi:hypothetical protein
LLGFVNLFGIYSEFIRKRDVIQGLAL